MIGRRLLPVLAVLLAASAGAGAVFAGSIFIETQSPNIQGEATTVGYENQIEILSESLGAANPACGGGSGGALSVSEFSFSKFTDRASIDLFAALRDRTVFGAFVVRFVTTVGGSNAVYQTYTFHNVVLSVGSTASGAGDPRSVESWSISFSDVTLEYTFYDGSGKNAGTESVTITPAVCPGS